MTVINLFSELKNFKFILIKMLRVMNYNSLRYKTLKYRYRSF